MENPRYKYIGKKTREQKQAKEYNIQEYEGQTQKAAKPRGRTQSIIDLLRKNSSKYAENSPSGIGAFLLTQQIKVNEKDQRFYSQVLLLTFNNAKININDILGGRLFHLYIVNNKYELDSCVFSNDKLFWLYMLYNNGTISPEIKNCFISENMSLVLQTHSSIIQNSYLKGFIQDYNKDFSLLGLNTFDTKDLSYNDLYDSLIAGWDAFSKKYPNYVAKYELKATDYSFKEMPIDNKKYKVYFIQKVGLFLCFLSTINKDAVIAKMKNTVLIENKSSNKNMLKVIEISKEYDRKLNIFISQKIKLSDFVPGIVILPTGLKYSYSLRVSLDMSLFDVYLYDKYTKEERKAKKIGQYFINNLIDWDTIDLFYNYNILLLSTRFREEKNEDKELIESIKKYVKYYGEMRSTFDNLKKFYNEMISLLLKFYDSFHNRINIDVCESIYKATTKLVRRSEFYSNNNEEMLNIANELKNTFGLENVMKICYNTFADMKSIITAYRNVVVSSKKVMSGNPDNLEANLRNTGKSIFELITKGIITEIRTPSAFLGNLTGTDKATEVIMDDYKKKSGEKKSRARSKIDKETDKSKISAEDAKEAAVSELLNDYGELGFNVYDSRTGKYDDSFNTWFNEHLSELDPELVEKLVIVGKSYLVNDKEAKGMLDALYEEKTEKCNALIDMFKNWLETARVADELREKEEREEKLSEEVSGKKSIGEFMASPYTKTEVAAYTKAPNLDTDFLAEGEIATADKQKILGITDYFSLRKVTPTGGQVKTLDAWRKRGITDDVLFKFYEKLKEGNKELKTLVIPAIGSYNEYVKALQKYTQEQHGGGTSSLKKGLGKAGGSESTMEVEGAGAKGGK